MHDKGVFRIRGQYKGKLYSEYHNEIAILIKMGRLDEAEKLLNELIRAIESDEGANNPSTLTWYYANLANIYHKRKDISKEIKTLETFVQKYKPLRTTLNERLENLKAIKA